MVLEDRFGLEGYPTDHGFSDWPSPPIDFELVGGYIVDNEGITTMGTSGYYSKLTYDSRLMTMHPPYFPQTDVWDTAYWEEVPEMTDDEHAGEKYIGDDRI
ncbi:MAG: hypothetical protein GF388_05545 [Candidatus Aegiribacteria sp.]|nr:hypothetical protein [Candidatus Aegiribacteria sp.]MBD3294668.1 hypothetical protein [Candidatus Fermentibacteria bacterium]